MAGWKQVLGDLAASRATPLKRFAFLLCGDPGDAEDLVQSTWPGAARRCAARPFSPVHGFLHGSPDSSAMPDAASKRMPDR